MNDSVDQSLGDLVAAHPAAARIFDRVGLDYCCRGDRTLADACAAAGLDAAVLAGEIDQSGGGTDVEWASLPPDALADHIVATHHVYLREELPSLCDLAAKVDGVHGARHRELGQVQTLLAELKADLVPHLDKEERVLFPAIRAVVQGGRRAFPIGSIANPISVMTAEHDRAGELLAALRSTTGGYEAPLDACTSYRLLYARLADLEHDTHVHIHKENHVLFPAALRDWETLSSEAPRQEVGTR